MIAAWIEQQQALCDAAIKGPLAFGSATEGDMTRKERAAWITEGLNDGDRPLWAVVVADSIDPVMVAAVTGDGEYGRNNAAFIAAARTSLPKALAALRAMDELVSEIDQAIERQDARIRAILATLDEEGAL